MFLSLTCSSLLHCHASLFAYETRCKHGSSSGCSCKTSPKERGLWLQLRPELSCWRETQTEMERSAGKVGSGGLEWPSGLVLPYTRSYSLVIKWVCLQSYMFLSPLRIFCIGQVLIVLAPNVYLQWKTWTQQRQYFIGSTGTRVTLESCIFVACLSLTIQLINQNIFLQRNNSVSCDVMLRTGWTGVDYQVTSLLTAAKWMLGDKW